MGLVWFLLGVVVGRSVSPRPGRRVDSFVRALGPLRPDMFVKTSDFVTDNLLWPFSDQAPVQPLETSVWPYGHDQQWPYDR